MKHLLFVCLGAGLLAHTASAQSQSLPDGPGKALVQRICSECHEPELVMDKKQTKEGWNATVDEMVSRGANGTDAEFDQIVAYLTKFFGKEGGKVNINKAAVNDIQSELAFTAKEAAAIVDYRTKNGAFKTLADLKKVPGIDGAKIDSKKDSIEF